MAGAVPKEVEAEAITLVEKMWSRKPANVRITPEVCLTVLRKKFADQFPTFTAFGDLLGPIAATLQRLEPPPPPKAATSDDDSEDDDSDYSDGDDDSSSDDDDADDDDSSSDDDEEADDDDENSTSTSGSDSSTGSDDDSSSASSAASEQPNTKKTSRDNADNADDEPPQKSRRTESTGDDAVASSHAAADGAALPTTPALVAAMSTFLKKLNVAHRKINDGESSSDYRSAVLDPLFAKHSLNAADMSKTAASKFKARQELAILTAEADITLDRSSRRGRATFPAVGAAATIAPRFAKPSFMDDE